MKSEEIVLWPRQKQSKFLMNWWCIAHGHQIREWIEIDSYTDLVRLFFLRFIHLMTLRSQNDFPCMQFADRFHESQSVRNNNQMKTFREILKVTSTEWKSKHCINKCRHAFAIAVLQRNDKIWRNEIKTINIDDKNGWWKCICICSFIFICCVAAEKLITICK